MRKILQKRQDELSVGKFSGEAEAMMSRKRVMIDDMKKTKVSNSMVCKGKISSVVRYIIEREKEGVLLPWDIDKIKIKGYYEHAKNTSEKAGRIVSRQIFWRSGSDDGSQKFVIDYRKVSNSMVCKGKISSVVWYIIEREKEGVYYYQEIQIKMRGWNIGGTGKKNSEGRDIPVSRVC